MKKNAVTMVRVSALMLILLLLVQCCCMAMAETAPAPAFEGLAFDAYAVELSQGEKSLSDDQHKGSVTITLSDRAEYDPVSNTLTMQYEHEQDSTHIAVVQIVYNLNGEELLLAQSGKIERGWGLYKMDALPVIERFMTGAHRITIRLLFYDPVTGARADFNTDIPGYMNIPEYEHPAK